MIPSKIHRPRRVTGSTIIVGLVIMAMATLGITAWIGLISARSFYVEGMAVSMKRRVAQMNARAAVSQYLYTNALTKDSSPAATLSIPATIGTGAVSISIPAMTDAPFSSTALAGAVRTGPGNGFSYAVEVPVVASISVDSDFPTSSHTTDYWLRSRSSLLAGDLVSMHLPSSVSTESNRVNGQLRVSGNIQQWGALGPHDVQNSPRSDTFSTPTVPDASLTSTDRARRHDGSWGPQWNFASMPVTSGDYSGSANAYKGYIDLVNSGRPWSLANKVLAGNHDVISGATAADNGRGASSNGSGTVDVQLDHLLGTNLLIGNGTTTLNLHGQDDAASYDAANAQRAIMIVVNQTATASQLTRINFHGENNRRLMLAVKRVANGGSVHFAFLDTSTSVPVRWRMLWVAENARMWLRPDVHNNGNTYSGGQPTGDVILTGGVLTDRRFLYHNNNSRKLFIERDLDPTELERFAPRVGWLEVYND